MVVAGFPESLKVARQMAASRTRPQLAFLRNAGFRCHRVSKRVHALKQHMDFDSCWSAAAMG
jgi:hypothetical protein